MTQDIKFNIEFHSNILLIGWIFDITTKNIPEIIDLRSNDDKIIRLNNFFIYRKDVNESFAIPIKHKIGFHLKVKNLFNAVVQNYALYVNNVKIWEYRESLNKLDKISLRDDILILIKNFNKRNIVIIYEKDSFLHQSLEKIYQWQNDYFNIHYHFGISYSFICIHELKSVEDVLLKINDRFFLIMEKVLIEKVFSLSPFLFEKAKIILLEETINLQTDWHGLLSVVCYYCGLKHGDNIYASSLMKLLTTFSNYADLFFDSTTFYTFHSGKIESWMNKIIRSQIQNKLTEDIVILSDSSVFRLRDIQTANCAIFVRLTAFHFLLDILPLSSIEFMTIALKRGAKVRVIQKDI